MAYIKTLKQGENQILPRTIAEAVKTAKGSTVQAELDEIRTLTPDVSAQISLHNSSEDAHPFLLERYQNMWDNYVAHRDNKSNPHEVTAAQVGADVAGSADRAILTAKAYTDEKVGSVDVSAQINAHNTNTNAHANMGWVKETGVISKISEHNSASDVHANMHWVTSTTEEITDPLPEGGGTGGVSSDAKTLEGHSASYFAVKTEVQSALDDILNRLSALENKMATAENNITGAKNNITSLTSKTGALETEVGNIKTEISGVASKIDTINGEVI